jgi:hypothetical protein
MPDIQGSQLEYANHTVLHPVGFLALLLGIYFLLKSPRDYVCFAVVCMAAIIPSAQRITVIFMDFPFLRLLVLAALFRAYGYRNDAYPIRRLRPDQLIWCWGLWSILSQALLYGTIAAAVTRAGYLIDAIGAYYVGRIYTSGPKSLENLIRLVRNLVCFSAAFFLFERFTGRNMFAAFGGVPFETIVREGRLRCQGPFPHAILAGVFWTLFLPWIWAQYKNTPDKKTGYLIGLAAVFVIVGNTASSTPAGTLLMALLGIALFKFRGKVSAMKWASLLALFLLHIAMEKPVWHLLARVDLAGGSTGWHRYFLIDRAIANFDDWWLFGTKDPGSWGRQLFDVTNQFILEGVRGGFLGLFFYVWFIMACFSQFGLGIKKADDVKDTRLIWASGVFLFASCISFLGVSFFGQTVPVFYLMLGISVSVSDSMNARDSNQILASQSVFHSIR